MTENTEKTLQSWVLMDGQISKEWGELIAVISRC